MKKIPALLPLLTALTLSTGLVAASSASPGPAKKSGATPAASKVQLYYDAQGKPVRNYVWSKSRGKPVFVRNASAVKVSDETKKEISPCKAVATYSLPDIYAKLLSKDEKGVISAPKLVRYTPINSYRTRRHIARLNHYTPHASGYGYGSGYGSYYGYSPNYYYASPRSFSYPRIRAGSSCRTSSGSIFGRAGSVGFKIRY